MRFQKKDTNKSKLQKVKVGNFKRFKITNKNFYKVKIIKINREVKQWVKKDFLLNKVHWSFLLTKIKLNRIALIIIEIKKMRSNLKVACKIWTIYQLTTKVVQK